MPCGKERDLCEVIQFQRKLVESVNSKARGKLVQVLHQTLVLFCDIVHDKSEISQYWLFLNFYKRIFNQFENISRQNKDTEAVSVQKMCLINLP